MWLYLSHVTDGCIMFPPIPWEHGGFERRVSGILPPSGQVYRELGGLRKACSELTVHFQASSLVRHSDVVTGEITSGSKWTGILQDGVCVLPLWVTVFRGKQLPYKGV